MKIISKCTSLVPVAFVFVLGCTSKPTSDTSASDVSSTPVNGAADDLADWRKLPKSTVSYSQFVDHICDLFSAHDSNGNGYLEPDELRKLPAWLGLSKADKRMTMPEVVAAGSAVFKKYASKNSKVLTRAQYDALEARK